MELDEAIEVLKDFAKQVKVKSDGAYQTDKGMCACMIAIDALKKQIPMKPYHISQVDDNDNANVECPACHATTDYAVNVIKRGHCWKCGQLLDWSDEE